jgi:hypothetical protein
MRPKFSSDAVRAVIRARRLRTRFFPEHLFADPAWDMLLDLLQAEIAQLRVPVSSLCIAAAVPATTALRWLKTVVQEGIFAPRRCQQSGCRDRRRRSCEAERLSRRFDICPDQGADREGWRLRRAPAVQPGRYFSSRRGGHRFDRKGRWRIVLARLPGQAVRGTSVARAVSSAGRASRLHREGRRFEPVTAHHSAVQAIDALCFDGPKPRCRRITRASKTAGSSSSSNQSP